jgi:hypothetical protein
MYFCLSSDVTKCSGDSLLPPCCQACVCCCCCCLYGGYTPPVPLPWSSVSLILASLVQYFCHFLHRPAAAVAAATAAVVASTPKGWNNCPASPLPTITNPPLFLPPPAQCVDEHPHLAGLNKVVALHANQCMCQNTDRALLAVFSLPLLLP